MRGGNAEAQAVERWPVEPPDGGTAWRTLYERPTPETEPVEDNGADMESSEAA